MASEEIQPDGDEVLADAPAATTTGEKLRYKSFRKKYRKMRLKFEDRMQEANNLFIKEHKAWDVARRLQEQNDQLLEILLDVNESASTHTKRRFNISSTSLDTQPVGSIEYEETKGFQRPRTPLNSLEERATFTLPDLPSPSVLPADLKDLDSRPAPGYLTSKNEDEYLDALDSALAAIPPTEHLSIDVETIQPTVRSRDKTLPTASDFAHQSMVSVHNWMRKHQPQVFDTRDKESEKGARAVSPVAAKGGRRGKERATKPDNADAAEEDEKDAESPGIGFAGRSRRNKDETYRPKGGKPRGKRKREDAEVPSARKARRTGAGSTEMD